MTTRNGGMGRARLGMRLAPLVLAGLAFAAAPGEAAPVLKVLLKTGLVVESDVGNLRKLTFSATTLTVIDKAGDSAQTPLSGIEKLFFTLPAPALPSRDAGRDGFSAWADGPGAVRLRLPAGGRINLGLFDLQGGQVRDLGVAELTAGEHRLTLGEAGRVGPDLPPGLYLFRISAPGRGTQAVLFTWTP